MLIPQEALKRKSKGNNRWKIRKVLEVISYYSGLDINDILLLLCEICGVVSPPQKLEYVKLPKEIPLVDERGRPQLRMLLVGGKYYLPSRTDLTLGKGLFPLWEGTKLEDVISYKKVARRWGFKVEKCPPQLWGFMFFIAAFNAQMVALFQGEVE